MLTQSELKSFFHYNPETGNFYRLARMSSRNPGYPNPTPRPDGYITLCINKKHYLCHVLAWLYVHGSMPKFNIDHIDGNKCNNSISNLRLCTHSQNAQNIYKPHKDSKTGFLGVYLHKSGLYGSRICTNGKTKSLGYYKNPEDAYNAYIEAKRHMHPFSNL
jgi:hypothetical protein